MSKEKNKNIVVIALKPGQLGNLLILYSNFIANGRAYNYSVYNPTFYEYADYFEHLKQSLFISYPKNSFAPPFVFFFRKLIYLTIDLFVRIMNRAGLKSGWGWQIIDLKWEENYNINSPDFIKRIKQKKYSLIWGWGFRDDRNYIKMSDEIRNFFSLREDLKISVTNFIDSIRKGEKKILVAIHIRHGDYKSFMKGKFFYTLPQYIDLMKKAENLFGKGFIKFILFSNNPQDMPKDTPEHCFGPGHFIEDLYAMAQCDYIIGPPSTFSRWASYYGKKPLYCVYEPSNEVTLNSFSDEEYNNLDSFKPWPPLI